MIYSNQNDVCNIVNLLWNDSEIYLLRKKLQGGSVVHTDSDSMQDIAEILTVLETSLQKELSLVEQLERLGRGLTEDAETEA